MVQLQSIASELAADITTLEQLSGQSRQEIWVEVTNLAENQVTAPKAQLEIITQTWSGWQPKQEFPAKRQIVELTSGEPFILPFYQEDSPLPFKLANCQKEEVELHLAGSHSYAPSIVDKKGKIKLFGTNLLN